MTPVLSITGSDNSGWSGLQLDLRIISEMGGHALTSATCIVMQNNKEVKDILNFPAEVVRQQVEDIVTDVHPRAVKVGLLRTPDMVEAVAKEIVGCRRIVVAPAFVSSYGIPLMDDDTLAAIKTHLIPKATLLILRCSDAEKMLQMRIATNEDMLKAARQLCEQGACNVMLRGGKISDSRLVALFYQSDPSASGSELATFFSSYNIEGWQQHGVGGALSAAIATRLAMGDDVAEAIRQAHEFIHSRVVYSVKNDRRRLRPADIYNEFLNLLSDNHPEAHDVAFYADRLNISTRYLSQITNDMVSKSPKQIIAEYLLREACRMLENSRLSVKEISQNLGFSTTALFCKFFKQQNGNTPSKYRLSVESLS